MLTAKTILRVSASILVTGALFGATNAFAQLDEILGKVRQSAEQVGGSNPTFYLKSAKAVEPNICLYPSGDPTGLIGPIVFRNSFVATPNCKEMKPCSEAVILPDEPMPTTCGAEIPDSRKWRGEEKSLEFRSDGTATLVVEDNGDGSERADRLAWCFCEPEPGGWVPVDAEDSRDDGAFMHWWATDAEVREDVGIESANIIPGTRRGCPAFVLSSYEFAEVTGEGQIEIQQ